MTLTRRKFLTTSAATVAALAFWKLGSRPADADASTAVIVPGPFQAVLGLAGAVPVSGMVP